MYIDVQKIIKNSTWKNIAFFMKAKHVNDDIMILSAVHCLKNVLKIREWKLTVKCAPNNLWSSTDCQQSEDQHY